jgi:hypothetical protein
MAFRSMLEEVAESELVAPSELVATSPRRVDGAIPDRE